MFSFLTPKLAGILFILVVIVADIGYGFWQHHRIEILKQELEISNHQLEVAKHDLAQTIEINKENQTLIDSLQSYMKDRDQAVSDLQTKVKKVSASYAELKKQNAQTNPDRPICPGVAQAIKDIQDRQ